MVKLGVVVDHYTTNAVLPIKTRVIVDNRQIVRYDNEEEKRSIYREESDFILKDIGHKHPDAIIISDYAKGCVGPWIKDLPTKMVYIDAHPKNYHLYPKDTHLKMNHKELQEITGFSDILTGIDIIKKDHATIVITQGAKGAFYLDNCRPVESVPSHKRQVSDVTGAGDAFMAAYVPALLITGNMAEAIKFANSYAGLSVEKTGSYHPSWKEIESGRTDD